jgi:hypothetical protein
MEDDWARDCRTAAPVAEATMPGGRGGGCHKNAGAEDVAGTCRV